MNVAYPHTHDSGEVLSPYGYQAPTPNLEGFAKDAAVFRNCFYIGPTCSSSRVATLTGIYPHQNGTLGLAQRGFKLDYGKYLVRYLNQNNYHMVFCGIQHEAGWYLDEGGGALIGYQEGLMENNSGYRQEDLVDWDKKNVGKVREWLEHYQGEKPFSLPYGMHATHQRYPDTIAGGINRDFVLPPSPIPDSLKTREDFVRYMTGLQKADECVGMVLDTLRRLGHMEDTIIFFTTDHGLTNPFRRCTLSDNEIGVVFMIRVPGGKSNGAVPDGLVSHVDVLPTLRDLLHLEEPDYLEGVSLAPMLEDTSNVRGEIFAEVNFYTSYESIRCARTERYKYIRYYDKDYLKVNRSNIDDSLTKAYPTEHGLERQTRYKERLYDLPYDTGERSNLADRPNYQETKEQLVARLGAYLEQTDDPIRHGATPVRDNWKVNKVECETASSKNLDSYVSLRKQGQEEMMTGIIAIRYGSYAMGTTSGLKLLAGEPEYYRAVDLLPESSTESLEEKLRDVIKQLVEYDKLLILADLVEGSPFNMSPWLKLSGEWSMEVIGGCNLPVALESYMSRVMEDDAEKLATSSVQVGREQLVHYVQQRSDDDGDYEE